jgi:predicted DNA-binding transcriptional regulator AlpA
VKPTNAEISHAVAVLAAAGLRVEFSSVGGGPDTLLTTEQACKRLGVSRYWLRDHASEVPRVTLPGGSVRFSSRAIDNLIQSWTPKAA